MSGFEIVKLFRSGYTIDQLVNKYKKYIKRLKGISITDKQAREYIEPIVYLEVMSLNNSSHDLDRLRKKVFPRI